MERLGVQGGETRAQAAHEVSPRTGPAARPPELTRVAGVEPSPTLPGDMDPPAHDPAEAFGQHFFRCFFCRIGDNRIEDHFCETGRELIVAMLDEIHDREFA